MATLCKPGRALPEYVVTQETMVEALRTRHEDVEKLAAKLQLVANTTVRRRYFLSPLQDLLIHEGIAARVERYLSAGLQLALAAIQQALSHAHLAPTAIGHLILTSCTTPGVALPGLDAYIVNAFDLPFTCRRLPIAQMGCQGGVTALAQAHSYLLGHPDEHVLVCAVELCSLNEQPGDTSASAFVSRGLFGDGACAAVVRGDDRAAGLRILRTGQYLVPGTIPHMQYQVDEQGNHFETKRDVVPGLKRGFPAVQTFLASSGYHPSDLAFLISHTGGPKVMDAVITELDVEEGLIAASRESLREVGNLSSATIFDVLYRTFETYRPADGAIGLMLGFGPGSTIEMALVQWKEDR